MQDRYTTNPDKTGSSLWAQIPREDMGVVKRSRPRPQFILLLLANVLVWAAALILLKGCK